MVKSLAHIFLESKMERLDQMTRRYYIEASILDKWVRLLDKDTQDPIIIYGFQRESVEAEFKSAAPCEVRFVPV